MSAFDFVARAMALRAAPTAVGLASDLDALTVAASADLVRTSGYSAAGVGGGEYVEDSVCDAAFVSAHPRFAKATANGRRFRLEPFAITPEQGGWEEGEPSSGTVISDAFAYQRAVAIGQDRAVAGAVELTPGATYAMSDIANRTFPGSAHVYADGRSFCPVGCRLAGNGATLKAEVSAGHALFFAQAEFLSTHVVSGAMASGTRVFQLATVGEAAQFAVGDEVLWRLGDHPLDAPETVNWGWARVASINSGAGQITIDRDLRLDWDGTGVNNKHLRRARPATGLVLDNVTFESANTSEPTTWGGRVQYGRDVWIGTVRGKGCGAGTLVLQYLDNFHVEYVEGRANNYNSAVSLTSGGRCVTIAESRGRVEHVFAEDCYMQAVFVEFGCDVTIGFLHDVVTNRNDGTAGSNRHRGVYAGTGSRVHVERALFEGYGEFLTHENAIGGRVTFGECRIVSAGVPFAVPVPGHDCDRLELCIDGVEELYIGGKARWIERTILLTDGMTALSEATGVLDFAPGAVLACHALFGGGTVAGDLSNFYVGRGTHSVDLRAELVPAAPSTSEVNLITAYKYGIYVANTTEPAFGAGTGNLGWLERAERARVRIVTPAGSSLAGAGKYVTVRMLIVPNELAAPLSATPNLAKQPFNAKLTAFANLAGAAAQGDLIYGSAAGTLSTLSKNASATRYLSNTGAANGPAWAQIDLTNGVTGILPSTGGGTGNGFTRFSGPAASEKTFTLPNASATIACLGTVQLFTADQTVQGVIACYGASGGFLVNPRNTGASWLLYHSSSTLVFYGNGSDRAYFTDAGVFTVTGGLGFMAGAGGTVTQATNKSAAVTLNKATGEITLNNAALAANTAVSFTLNDSLVAATDLVVAQHQSGGTIGAYSLNARATGAGTTQITVRNLTAGSLNEAIVVKFAVIKAVNV